ncbi:MAG: pentapeptide repeat-containing protein [Acidobacteria bacterium]|nr:pentapeptide repeat-containing protein [Acidobacteriota bacterium]
MTITSADLPAILAAHGKWRRGEAGGAGANLSVASLSGASLSGADLTGANLTGANLTGANLTGAYLSRADLTGAYLTGADLSVADLTGAYLTGAYLTGAYLTGADLTGAYLTGANLTGANLSVADLTGAYLTGADLTGADLSVADLTGANLTGAYLTGADLSVAYLPAFQIPQEGSLIGWKAVCGGIAKLEIPTDAKRTACLINRKCRAEFVRTLELVVDGQPEATSAPGRHDEKTAYTIGEITRPDSYDDDIRVDCTHGIHFFLTKSEAEKW